MTTDTTHDVRVNTHNMVNSTASSPAATSEYNDVRHVTENNMESKQYLNSDVMTTDSPTTSMSATSAENRRTNDETEDTGCVLFTFNGSLSISLDTSVSLRHVPPAVHKDD